MSTHASHYWNTPLFWITTISGFLLITTTLLVLGISPLIALVLCTGLISIVLLFHSPLLLLSLLFIVRMSLDYSSQYLSVSFFNVNLSLSQLVGLGIAFLGGIFLFLHGRPLLRFPLLFPFALVGLWGVFTLTYSINPTATLSELLRFFNLFIIGALAYVSVKRYRDFRTLLQAIFISSILPILFGLYQFAMGIGLQDENVSIPRIFGTFSHPNVYSLFLFALIALGTLYFLIYAKSTAGKLLLSSYLVLVTLTLILTYARIAWIALFVFLGLLAFSRLKILLIPLILFPFLLTMLSPSIQERVSEAFHPTPDSSITWRKNLWHDMSLKTKIEEREWLGSGMDTFRTSSEALRGLRFGSNDPHNDFVKFYVEGGRVGVAVLSLYILSFLWFVTRIYFKTPSHSLRHLAAITGFVFFALLLASLSDNVFKNTPVQWVLWTLMGGLLALYRESTKKSLGE